MPTAARLALPVNVFVAHMVDSFMMMMLLSLRFHFSIGMPHHPAFGKLLSCGSLPLIGAKFRYIDSFNYSLAHKRLNVFLLFRNQGTHCFKVLRIKLNGNHHSHYCVSCSIHMCCYALTSDKALSIASSCVSTVPAFHSLAKLASSSAALAVATVCSNASRWAWRSGACICSRRAAAAAHIRVAWV